MSGMKGRESGVQWRKLSRPGVKMKMKYCEYPGKSADIELDLQQELRIISVTALQIPHNMNHE